MKIGKIILIVGVVITASIMVAADNPPKLVENVRKTAGPLIPPPPGDEMYKDMSIFVSVMQRLNHDYVDADKVTFRLLIRGALTGMLAALDKYSSYLPPQEFKGLVEDTGGKYVGIGIGYSWNGKSLRVEKIMPDSPAFRAGIQPGDDVIAVNGKVLADVPIKECVEMLRGDSGSSVKLRYLRNGVKEPVEIEVVRDEVVSSPVPESGCKFVADGIGYIRINVFSAPLAGFLEQSMDKLKQQKLNGLVIDLRDNPGGMLDAAVQVCSKFIPTGKTVVRTVGRRPQDNITYWSIEGTKDLELPIAILINHGSASSAEITAGCLKDYRRALLIGENTYGKASVQRVQTLPEGYGGIRFTVAYYHTPNDIRIHEHGIEPDIRVDMPDVSRAAFRAQLYRYPGVIKPDAKGTVTDIQLQRAVEVLQGVSLFMEKRH